MSTRGAWGFRLDGVDKIAYVHCDAYPESPGLGQRLVNAVRRRTRRTAWLSELARDVRRVRLVVERSTPSPEDIRDLSRYADLGVGSRSLGDWYCLLRETQGDMEATLDAGVMIDSAGFLADSLFCEWAYVINLDDCVLEVYRGFQSEPHSKGRYAAPSGCSVYYLPARDGCSVYHPVALVASLPLDDLPKKIESRIEREDS